MDGLQTVLEHCLGIDPDNIKLEEDNSIHHKAQQNAGFTDKFKEFFGSNTFKPLTPLKGTKVSQETVISIFKKFKDIIVSCIYCWDQLAIYIPKDYSFTRSGVTPYKEIDETLMIAMIEEQVNKKSDFSFDDYALTSLNSVQVKVNNFLKPINFKFPSKFRKSQFLQMR